jgi:hypothetical protein
MDPRAGGILLLDVPNDDVGGDARIACGREIRTTCGLAQYEVIPWYVGLVKESLDVIARR